MIQPLFGGAFSCPEALSDTCPNLFPAWDSAKNPPDGAEKRANKPRTKGQDMGAENESNATEATEAAAEATENAAEASTNEAAEAGADDASDDGIKDKHGQPGINKERHEKEVADLRAEIAKLKTEAADAAEAKAKREEYEKKAADLEAKMADTEVTHKLELAGCRSVKAAKALLDDFGGDVSKLKAEHPYLFEKDKQTGRAGGKPGGAPDGMSTKINAAMGVKD